MAAGGSASEELLKHPPADAESAATPHSAPEEPDITPSGWLSKGSLCVTILLLASSGMGSGMIALPYAVGLTPAYSTGLS